MSDVGTQAEWVDVANSYAPQTPEACYATFYQKANFLKVKSEIEGRPIYENEEYIRIITPGDNKSIVERPVKDGDKTRFPEQYARFRASEDQIPDGIPLKTVGWLQPSQVAELEHINIFTVEQLADLSDAHLDKSMGLLDLRKRAQQFVQPADDTYRQQQAEIAELKQQVAALTSQHRQETEGDEPEVAEPVEQPAPARRRRRVQ